MRTGTRQRRFVRMTAALPALLLILILVVMPGQLHAQPRDGSMIFIPEIVAEGVVATPPPVSATGERVYGLLGELSVVTDAVYATRLTTATGLVYGLVGETPDLELEIVTLARAANVTTVKVWGELRPGANSLAMIVVSGIMPTEVTEPAGGASSPVAIVKFSLVNLYAGPGSSFAKVGQVVLNQACNITGRNATRTWWQLTCADGTVGWIDARLVTVEGSTATVAVAAGQAVAPPATMTPPTPTPVPTPTPAPQYTGWQASYYDNVLLSGQPVATANVGDLNLNWGLGSPSTGVSADGFSARFERTYQFPTGNYRFSVDADDGVRVWLDDQLIIDEWHGAQNQVYTVNRVLAGAHRLRVEYYEASGSASIRFAYAVVDGTRQWQAAYYAGVQPSGATVLSQAEPASQTPLDFNWSYSSPLPDQLGPDYWSARWTGRFPFDYGTYIFRIEADDGVRVYVDGLLVIDQWRDGYKEVSNRFVGIGSGDHTVTVEYYERTGTAQVQLWWYRDTGTVTPR